MKTTLRKIKSFDPCINGWKTLLKTLGTADLDTEVTLLQILDNDGPKDAFWALRCWPYRQYCLLLADVAESVLSIFEVEFPEDGRPRTAIEAAYAAADAAAYAAAAHAADAAADAAAAHAADASYAVHAVHAAYAAYAAAAYNQWQKNGQLMRNFIKEGEDQ